MSIEEHATGCYATTKVSAIFLQKSPYVPVTDWGRCASRVWSRRRLGGSWLGTAGAVGEFPPTAWARQEQGCCHHHPVGAPTALVPWEGLAASALVPIGMATIIPQSCYGNGF